ncbi:hypothetical protein PFISCL1PPCAC_1358, partial [Pristionchus fissidentatus]
SSQHDSRLIMVDSPVKQPRKCLVCSATVTAAHLGMDCCKACAVFFKRAKLAGKLYECRAGNRQCTIVNNDKFSCRGCRFNRCVAVGLVYDGPLRINKKKEKELMQSPASTSSSDLTSRSNSIEGAEETTLTRIGRAYNASIERRRRQEESILAACNEDIKIVPHPTQRVYLASYDTSMRAYDACVAETLIFFREAFPSLARLSRKEQDAVFKGYISKLNMIECHWRTRKTWGEMRQYCMSSVLIAMDLEAPDEWVGDQDGAGNRKTLVESIRSGMNCQFALIIPLLDKAQMTSTEFHALLALVLCEIDVSCEVSDHVYTIAEEIRKEVLDDLQRYYKYKMNIIDCSTRLGNLMTLTHAVRECNSLFLESFRMQITVFDLFQSEEMIKELIL